MHKEIHTHRGTHLHMHGGHTCTHTWRYMHTHGDTCTHMGIHAHAWGYTHIHGDTRTYMGIHAHTWGYTYTHMGTHTVCPHVYMCMLDTRMKTHINLDVHMHIHTHEDAHAQGGHTWTHTHTHTYAHTHTYTHTHTHTHLSIQSIYHEMIHLTTSSALSFIIYPCRTIFDGIVTNILGHLRHTYCICNPL